MDGVEIRSGRGRGLEQLPWTALPFLLCGVWGLLLLFRGLKPVRFDEPPVFLTATILCIAFWTAYRFAGRLFAPILLLSAPAAALLAGREAWDTLVSQILSLVRFYTDGASPESVDALAMTLAAALPWLLFLLECLFRDHDTPDALAASAMIVSPLAGLHIGLVTAVLLTLYRTVCQTAQSAARRGRRALLAPKRRTRLAGQCAAVTALALALSLLASIPLAVRYPDQLFAPAYAAESFASKLLRRWQDRAQDAGGRLANGNNYPTGETALTVSASHQPGEMLYLWGFRGGDYRGGQWLPADDDALYLSMREPLAAAYGASTPAGTLDGEPDWLLAAQMTAGELYYLLNYWSWQLSDGDIPGAAVVETYSYGSPRWHTARAPAAIEGRTLTIQGGGSGLYLPYFAYLPTEPVRQNGAYRCSYYELSEMGIRPAALAGQSRVPWLLRFQDAYGTAAKEAYTRVPRDSLPRLTALVEENPQSGLDNITAFILHTLHTNARYTLTPGRTPLGHDLVEDFLFDRGQGYCQHFAAAATLMYRLYGIPARYVTGYVARPDEFVPLPSVSDAASDTSEWWDEEPTYHWHATLTDRSAHAWVEIWLEGYGWTPVEVTPPASDSAAGTSAQAVFPGFNADTYQDIQQSQGWLEAPGDEPGQGGLADSDTETPDLTLPGQNPEDPRSDDSTGGDNDDTAPDEPETLRHDGGPVGYFLFTLTALLLLSPLIVVRRREYLLKRAASEDCRAAFDRLTRLLRFAGRPVEEYPSGPEADSFPERLHETVPAVSREAAELLAQAVSRAAFGPGPSLPADDAFARSVCRTAAGAVYGELSPAKRALFRWVYVYG